MLLPAFLRNALHQSIRAGSNMSCLSLVQKLCEKPSSKRIQFEPALNWLCTKASPDFKTASKWSALSYTDKGHSIRAAIPMDFKSNVLINLAKLELNQSEPEARNYCKLRDNGNKHSHMFPWSSSSMGSCSELSKLLFLPPPSVPNISLE